MLSSLFDKELTPEITYFLKGGINPSMRIVFVTYSPLLRAHLSALLHGGLSFQHTNSGGHTPTREFPLLELLPAKVFKTLTRGFGTSVISHSFLLVGQGFTHLSQTVIFLVYFLVTGTPKPKQKGG